MSVTRDAAETSFAGVSVVFQVGMAGEGALVNLPVCVAAAVGEWGSVVGNVA